MDGRGSDCDMDSELYQYFFATEFVDMFPQTNGDILLQSTLVWSGSRKLTSIRTYRATPRLAQYSAYYKNFSGVLEVRTVKAEYLVAMKLMSGRKYKKDLSDVAGILYEQQLSGDPLTYERIDRAVCNLYGDWNAISEETKDLLNRILACENLRALFVELSEDEQTAKDALIEVEKKYPSAVKEDTADSIIAIALQKKKDREGR